MTDLKKYIGYTYCGLTNDVQTEKQLHNNPSDFTVFKFNSAKIAKSWIKTMLKMNYSIGEQEHIDWQYGYLYTVSERTNELNKSKTLD